MSQAIDVTYTKTVNGYNVVKFREMLTREIGEYFEGLDLNSQTGGVELRMRDESPNWVVAEAIHIIYDGYPPIHPRE